MTDWSELTDRTLKEIDSVDPVYRPTNFWGPGVTQLADSMTSDGLQNFKSWPLSRRWFYPVYGCGFTNATISEVSAFATTVNPRTNPSWVGGGLSGGRDARRDFDVARLMWDQDRWPFDIEGFGESRTGNPPQYYKLVAGKRHGWTKPYLNYLLCLAALSRHVDAPPRSFLEIGGGYGVLGEIVMSRDPRARYVNLDIPPLMTVSAYYLDSLFGAARVLDYTSAIADRKTLDLSGSACLPNWRLPDVKAQFDVFLNSFSFQEMEPDVVLHYVNAVADLDVDYVVSLNSKKGKPTADKVAAGSVGGVLEPVTSTMIAKMFKRRGYELLQRYTSPLLTGSAGEVIVLRRKAKQSRQVPRRAWLRRAR